MALLPVKWYHSMMRGIPLLSNQAGTLVAMLDACLINGFGQVSSNSMSVTDGVLTVNLLNSETFLLHSVVAIAGDDQLKGEYRVIESHSTYIKVLLNIPNQVFTNTIYVKYAPLGWSKITPTAPANTALYIPKESFSGFNLYVNDNFTKAAHVRLCRGASNTANMANETSLIDYVPISVSNYPFWAKGYNATPKPSFLIGDVSSFYFLQCGNNRENNYEYIATGKLAFCGDIVRYNNEDHLAAVINVEYFGDFNSFTSHSNVDTFTRLSSHLYSKDNSASLVYKTFLGDHRGIKGNDFAGRAVEGYYVNDSTVYSGSTGFNVEQSLTGGVELNKMLAINEKTVRGEYPGVFFLSQMLSNIDDLTIEPGSGDLAGKLIMFKRSSTPTTWFEGQPVACAFDITGPWR